MVTISVRIPDRVYRQAKRIAAESGMSFGEVVRRGMEQMVRLFPEGRQRSADWRPPRPRGRGKPFARVIPEPAVSSFFGAGANTITLPPDLDDPVGVAWDAAE